MTGRPTKPRGSGAPPRPPEPLAPPPVPPLDTLDALFGAATPSEASAWWISMQTTEHVLGAPASRDPHTGEPVPASLRDLLRLLDEETRGAAFPIPVDALFQSVEHCARALAEVIARHRTRVIREHERVPPHRLREMDATSVAWLARRPGRTVREKLSGLRTALGVVRRFTPDTPENRVAVTLAALLAPRIAARVASAREAKLYDDRPCDVRRLDLLEETLAICTERLHHSDLGEVSRTAHLRANNALLSDPIYSCIWRAFRRLRLYEEQLPSRWMALPERLRTALLWIVAARLASLGVTTPYDGIARASPDDGARGFGIEQLTSEGGWTPPRRTSVILRVIATATEEPRAIRLRLVERGLAAELLRFEGHAVLRSSTRATIRYDIDLARGAAPVRRGVPLVVETRGGGDVRRWTGFGDLPGLGVLAEHIAHDLSPRSTAPRYRPPAPGGSDAATGPASPLGADLAAAVIRVARGEQVRAARTQGWAARYRLGVDGAEWIDGDGERVLPLGLAQPAITSLADVLDPELRDDGSFSRGAARRIVESLAMELQLAPESRLAYAIPDAADEVAQRTLRSAMSAVFPRSFPVWRSIAAAMGWQCADRTASTTFSEAGVQEGDAVVILDAESPVLTRTVLVARRDDKLARCITETGGMYWERRPSPASGERDQDLALRALLEQLAGELLARALQEANEQLDEERRSTMLEHLVQTGAMERLVGTRSTLAIPLDPTGARLLELTHDPRVWHFVLDRWERGVVEVVHEVVALGREVSPSGIVHVVLVGLPFRDRGARIQRHIAEHPRFDRPPHLVVLDQNAIARGAAHCLVRLDADCRTWAEWLPDLHLEVIRDGLFDEFQLIEQQRIEEPILGEQCDLPVAIPLILDAGHPWFDFPIVSGRTVRLPLASEARLQDARMPFAEPLPVRLRVRYRYGVDHSYELWFEPLARESAPFASRAATWRSEEDRGGTSQPAAMQLEPAGSWDSVDEDRLRTIYEVASRFDAYERSPRLRERLRIALRELWSEGRSLATASAELREAMSSVTDGLSAITMAEGPLRRDALEALCVLHEDAPPWMIELQLAEVTESRQEPEKEKERERYKAAVRGLAMLAGDGTGVRLRCLVRLVELLREYSTTSFEPSFARITLSELVRALWRHPQLVDTLGTLGRDTSWFLVRVVRRGLSNLLARVSSACAGGTPDIDKLERLWSGPFRDTCELLLALLRLRDRSAMPSLREGEPLAEHLARHVRLLDSMFTRARARVRWSRTFRSPASKPHELARISDTAWTLNVLLTGDPEIHLVRLSH